MVKCGWFQVLFVNHMCILNHYNQYNNNIDT